MVEYLSGGRIQGIKGDSLGSSADGTVSGVTLDTTNEKLGSGCYSFDGINDIIVASVGTFVVRIHKDQTVAKGDLLQSNGDGTAKKQSDDNVKSSSFAKVLSNTKIETYEDGSYIVPCSLMC